MARTLFSKEQQKFVSEQKQGEHYAVAFDANTFEPIFVGDTVSCDIFEHGEWRPVEFLCFEYTGKKSFKSRYVKRIVVKENAFHIINGIAYHYIENHSNVRYFKHKI